MHRFGNQGAARSKPAERSCGIPNCINDAELDSVVPEWTDTSHRGSGVARSKTNAPDHLGRRNTKDATPEAVLLPLESRLLHIAMGALEALYRTHVQGADLLGLARICALSAGALLLGMTRAPVA